MEHWIISLTWSFNWEFVVFYSVNNHCSHFSCKSNFVFVQIHCYSSCARHPTITAFHIRRHNFKRFIITAIFGKDVTTWPLEVVLSLVKRRVVRITMGFTHSYSNINKCRSHLLTLYQSRWRMYITFDLRYKRWNVEHALFRVEINSKTKSSWKLSWLI